MRPGKSDASVPNCSAITKGAVIGQHDAARADADASMSPAATCPMTTAVAALAMPGMP